MVTTNVTAGDSNDLPTTYVIEGTVEEGWVTVVGNRISFEEINQIATGLIREYTSNFDF